jgi:hypothetical protein
LLTCWAGKAKYCLHIQLNSTYIKVLFCFTDQSIPLYLAMRRSGVFSTMLFLSIIWAGAYGIIHDQLTAFISPEYYTRFKFVQFQVDPGLPFRQGVTIVGFFATWWMGAAIGLILGVLGFLFRDHRAMKKVMARSLLLVSTVACITGIAGFIYGKYFQDYSTVSRWFPEGLQDKDNFILTGTIHNFSYMGGLAGLIIAIIFLLLKSGNTSYPGSINAGKDVCLPPTDTHIAAPLF